MSFTFVFFNSTERLRSGWRFGVFCLLFFILTTVLVTIANLIVNLSEPLFSTDSVFALGLLIQFFALLFPAVFVGWLCAKWLEDLPFKSLGWSFERGNSLRDLAFGFALGTASLLLAALVAALAGNLGFSLNRTASPHQIVGTILISLAIFGFGAASEEALFRGYPLQTFARAKLIWIAVLLTSIVFAAAHWQNPNATWLGLFNTALAGVWFVVAFMKTRTLWFPFGLHWAWNWTMGAILGIPVSGIKELTPAPLFNPAGEGSVWLTGGSYGLEGGAACTLALTVSTALIWFAPFLKPSAEILALTDQENP